MMELCTQTVRVPQTKDFYIYDFFFSIGFDEI